MSVEQALARPNYALKKETPHYPVRRFLFIVFLSWHTVSGFPVKATSPLIPRANSAYPAVWV